MTTTSITIAPFLIFAEDPKSFRQTHAYQPSGPDSITKGYAILKNRGDDEVPEEMMAGSDVRLLVIAAKALAANYNVPLLRPEWFKSRHIPRAIPLRKSRCKRMVLTRILSAGRFICVGKLAKPCGWLMSVLGKMLSSSVRSTLSTMAWRSSRIRG
jgi:hypothetical protein